MAAYEYKCHKCGKVRTIIMPMSSVDGFVIECEGDTAAHEKTVMLRKYTPPTNIMEPSGDGYFVDSRTGLTSRGRPKKVRWM